MSCASRSYWVGVIGLCLLLRLHTIDEYSPLATWLMNEEYGLGLMSYIAEADTTLYDPEKA